MRPHKNLLVWKESISFVENIYSLTRKLPDSEKFGLISQLKRAAVSIPTNVAEGAARNTRKEFIHFLYISSGSLSEVDTLLTIASNPKFINAVEHEIMTVKISRIASLMNGLIRKLKSDQDPPK
jgi:four helix bundle protein